jgi:hypothetical protein
MVSKAFERFVGQKVYPWPEDHWGMLHLLVHETDWLKLRLDVLDIICVVFMYTR